MSILLNFPLQEINVLTLGILISLRRVISKEIHHHRAGILSKICSLDGVLGDVHSFRCGSLDYIDLIGLALLAAVIDSITRG